MVARISFPKRLLAALNYNENKCSKGAGKCIGAVNYLMEANEMNFHQKLSLLQMRNELNERATTKTIHISLNFDLSEKLSNEKLTEIANCYMERIGLIEQPYLVYKHTDAAHPHVHIVSTMIKEDGTRMNTHNIGRIVSEKARKEIEKEFGLIEAGKQKKSFKQSVNASPPLSMTKTNGQIIYGKSELKRSINNIVNEVFNQYRFSSLPEFNAALKQFNVIADMGKEQGRIYKNGGLVYRALDAKGNKVGVPVKASSISCQPTLKNLQKKFEINDSLKEPLKERIKGAIDALKTFNSMDSFVQELKKKNIVAVLRQNNEGRIYGITFVDNERKVVFNGSDLGREFSAANLMNRIQVTTNTKEHKIHTEEKNSAPGVSLTSFARQKEEIKPKSIIEDLMSAQMNKENIPFELRKRKKKKRKINTIH